MIANVQSRRLSIVSIVFALFLSSALLLPQVVRSQEEGATTTQTTNTTTAAPYVTEGIPGGDAVVGDFVVGPGKVELEMEPGESHTVELKVTNRTGEEKRFDLSTEDMRGSQNTEQTVVLLGDDRGPYSMKDFVSIPHMQFELGHNERALVPVTITIPEDAEPGGLYGSVLVETVSVEARTGDVDTTVPQSPIVARIGTLFFITIPGDVEQSGELKDFSTVPRQSWFQSGPITFEVLFENTGSIHLNPYGELRVTNMLGEEVGVVELDPWFVLPGALRLREVIWEREFLFGKYTATVEVNRGYDDIVDTMEYSFWVLPWKVLALGAGALFLLIFLIRLFFRKFEFKRKEP